MSLVIDLSNYTDRLTHYLTEMGLFEQARSYMHSVINQYPGIN